MLSPHTAEASLVYGDPASLSSDRAVSNGLISTSGWEDASIEWDIAANGGTYTYTYTFHGFSKPDISHIVLDLSDNALDGKNLADPHAVQNATVNGEDAILEFDASSFPHKPGIIGGLKFDEIGEIIGEDAQGPLVLSFTSNRSPVWGHVAVKGGQNLLTNLAYDSEDTGILANPTNFIARPNGVMHTVPSPNSAVTAVLLLMGLMLRRRPART